MTAQACLRDWRKKTVCLPGWKDSCSVMAHCLPACRSAFSLYPAPAISVTKTSAGMVASRAERTNHPA